LKKNKEQDKFKCPEMHPLYVIPDYSHYAYNPNIHIIPDGYGGFKIDPGHYEVTTTSTTSLNPKEPKEQ